jgi:hypothetical protein
MTVSVVVPWSPGCPHRERAWAFVQDRYDGLEVVTGASPPGPYNRSAAILDGAAKASGDILLVADADVFCDPTQAIAEAELVGWAVPHMMLHRLAPESTERVLAGADWRGLPLSTDNPQDRKPYRGNLTGTMVAIRRDVLAAVPPDPRFVGWGSEDQAWAMALRTLIGRPWRGDEDLVHLWHPAQPRLNRRVGTEQNRALLNRYHRAKHKPARMSALVDEAREASPWTSCRT